ncbi:MAG TPA: carbohydrate ABC transporter permease, partial [Chloroflexota bacterium]|nr:carbohydrate ABC transporter permease [Chloroflexota bacterium]
MSATAATAKVQASSVTQASRWKKPKITRVLFWIIVLVIIVWLLFPFYWAIRTSLTPEGHLYDTPVAYWPSSPTLSNYTSVLGDSLFRTALLNSAFVGITVTLLSLVIGASAAYALARFNFRGRGFMMYLVLSMTMFPQIAILTALYQLINDFHFYDTLWALVISYMLFTLPFTVWVLTSFFRALPREL